MIKKVKKKVTKKDNELIKLKTIITLQQKRLDRICQVLLNTIPKEKLDAEVNGYDCCTKHKNNWLILKDFLSLK